LRKSWPEPRSYRGLDEFALLADPARRIPDADELREEIELTVLPTWNPVPEGLFAVDYLVREYVSTAVS
jgi:hypothetical protein